MEQYKHKSPIIEIYERATYVQTKRKLKLDCVSQPQEIAESEQYVLSNNITCRKIIYKKFSVIDDVSI